MTNNIKKYWHSGQIKELIEPQNIGLYVFAVIVLAIAWSGAKAVQKNYDLQKQIAYLKQQNEVLHLSNSNIYLQNQYYKTDEFLELSARRNFGLAAPGETVLLIPKDVALKHVDPSIAKNSDVSSLSAAKKSRYGQNLDDWRDFLLGRRLF